MTTEAPYVAINDEMSDKLFRQFKEFIENEVGIRMPDIKKTMLQARLQKRLRKLGISTFERYYQYVFSPEGIEAELQNMIDAVTTNKTDFFREPQHFSYLTQTVLPRMVYRQRERHIKVWSAGCSTGEEPYTLAMVLSDFAHRSVGFDFSILATDISVNVLNKAIAGIYDEERIEPIPTHMRKKYLLKSKDREKRLIRIIPELRSRIRFKRLNLLDSHYNIAEPMDIIFFRNVLIYFERPTQEEVLTHIAQHLHPDGYLFIGHSETLTGLKVPLIAETSTVYRRRR